MFSTVKCVHQLQLFIRVFDIVLILRIYSMFVSQTLFKTPISINCIRRETPFTDRRHRLVLGVSPTNFVIIFHRK